MQFGLAFTFPFQDTNWIKKILIMAVISIIPIVGSLVLLGWALEITRRVVAAEQPTLPDSIDFGGWLVKGIMGFVIAFVYALPIIILAACLGLVSAVPGLVKMDSNTAGTLVMLVSLCGGCIIALLGILEAIIIPAAFGNFAASGQIGAAFKFGDVIALVRAAPAAYLLVVVGSLVAGIIGGLGTIACIIGVLATMAYSQIIMGHLYGQAYLVAKAKLAEAPVAAV